MEVLHVEAGAGDPGPGPGPQQMRRSRRRVQYRASEWRVHQWEVRAGGEVLCRAVALRTGGGALLLWVGSAGAGVLAELGAVALGMPAERTGGGALCSLLAGGAGAEGSMALARRLAAALWRPVTVCCALPFDRFTAPLVERGLVAEIKSRPDYFVETK